MGGKKCYFLEKFCVRTKWALSPIVSKYYRIFLFFQPKYGTIGARKKLRILTFLQVVPGTKFWLKYADEMFKIPAEKCLKSL